MLRKVFASLAIVLVLKKFASKVPAGYWRSLPIALSVASKADGDKARITVSDSTMQCHRQRPNAQLKFNHDSLNNVSPKQRDKTGSLSYSSHSSSGNEILFSVIASADRDALTTLSICNCDINKDGSAIVRYCWLFNQQ